jgi:hypothetical protein
MITLLITNVYVSDGAYYITCNNDETAVFKRSSDTDILGLPSWSTMLADLVDAHGASLEGKTLVVTSTSITVLVELQ